MRYGVYGDIHGNLEALDAVFAFFETKNIDHYLCVGDIVNYGPTPKERTAKVKESESLVVAMYPHFFSWKKMK